jgi:K+-transporting ATPase A subunit
MSYYRVVFRQDEVLSCFPTTQQTYVNESNVVYENEIAQLTFALVKAASDADAIAIATRMVREQRQKH